MTEDQELSPEERPPARARDAYRSDKSPFRKRPKPSLLQRISPLKALIASLNDEGIAFALARVKRPLQRTLEEVGVLDLIGENRVFPTVRDAVEAGRRARKEV